MNFEVTINYWDYDQTGMSPRLKMFKRKVLLMNAINYTEAEAEGTSWGTKITNNSFDIYPIDQSRISIVCPYKEIESDVETNEEGYFWFECKGVFFEVNERGKEKKYSIYLLVQDESIESASKRALVVMQEAYFSDPKIEETKLSTIEDVVIMNDNI